VRRELCNEAIRLAAMLSLLMPDESEAHGLHALLLFQDARRDARVRDGSLVLLEDQDRALWHADEIAAGRRSLERALCLPARGPYAIQAGIAAAHSEGASDWRIVAELYARLAELEPSPVVELNRAVAVAMADGPEAGLALVDAIDGLDDYYLFHSARADLLRRLERVDEAHAAYERASELAPSDVERDFLAGRRRAL
jgi:RNA polymerase sigma-70 factor (ECF subfamily)